MGGGGHQEASVEQLQPMGNEGGGHTEKRRHAGITHSLPAGTGHGLDHHSSSSSSSRGGRFRLKKPTWGCRGPGTGYENDP